MIAREQKRSLVFMEGLLPKESDMTKVLGKVSEKRTMEDIVHPISGKVLVHKMGHVTSGMLTRFYEEYGIERFRISINGQECMINLAIKGALDFINRY